MTDFEAALACDEDTVEADFRFHTLVAAASDNRYFTSVMASFCVKAIPRAGPKARRDLSDNNGSHPRRKP